jgi:hypothetical protein
MTIAPTGQPDPPLRRLERQAELPVILSFAPLHSAPDPSGSHEVLKAWHIEVQQQCYLGRLNDGTVLLERHHPGRAGSHDTVPLRRQLFVCRAEELVMDTVGRNARIPQTGNEVPQEGTGTAEIDLRFRQGRVGP